MPWTLTLWNREGFRNSGSGEATWKAVLGFVLKKTASTSVQDVMSHVARDAGNAISFHLQVNDVNLTLGVLSKKALDQVRADKAIATCHNDRTEVQHGDDVRTKW